MNRSTISSLAFAAALAAAAHAQGPFTIGNVVLVRAGDGSVALTANAAPIFLDEYTTTGAFVQSIPLPTVASGSNHAITIRGSATSEGYLNVSGNGIFLLLTGYDCGVGTPTLLTEGSPASVTNRVVARVDITGNIDTSTSLTDAYDGANNGTAATTQGNVRAAVSDDGMRFWLSGTGSPASAGMRYVSTVGATTSLALNSGAPTNCRVAGIQYGQLYTTSASTVFLGVCQVGTGLPTAPSQPISLLPGFPTTGGTAASSAYDFFFADPNTVYVADDNSIGSSVGGISKWTFNGTVWSRQYRLLLAPDTGCRGLTGFVRNGVTTLWGTVNTTNTGGAATQLVTVTDTGPSSVVTSLVTSPANTAFRGLRFLAKPTTVSRIPAACGSAGIDMNGNAEVGTDVRTTVLSPVGFPFIGYGLTQLMVPFCNCTVVHDFTLLLGGPSHTLSLPNNPTLMGIQVFAQGLDFLAPGGCPDPTFTLTDGFSFTIQ